MSPDLNTSWLDAMERVKGLNFRQKSCTDPWNSHCGSLDLNDICSIYNYLEHLECAHMRKTYLYACIYSKQIQKTSQRLGFSLIVMQSEPDRFFLTHKQQWRKTWQIEMIETLNSSHTNQAQSPNSSASLASLAVPGPSSSDFCVKCGYETAYPTSIARYWSSAAIKTSSQMAKFYIDCLLARNSNIYPPEN